MEDKTVMQSAPAVAEKAKPDQSIEASVSPAEIVDGEKAKLSWRATNATRVKLGGAVVELSGSRDVSPSLSTNFVFEVEGAAKEPVSKIVPLKVKPHPPAKPATPPDKQAA